MLALYMFFEINGFQSKFSLSDGLEKTIEMATFRSDFEGINDKIIQFLKEKERVYIK